MIPWLTKDRWVLSTLAANNRLVSGFDAGTAQADLSVEHQYRVTFSASLKVVDNLLNG